MNSSLVFQHLIPSKSSLGLKSQKSSSPSLILRRNTSISIGEFKGTHDKQFQILNLPLTVSGRGLSKISCSLSLQTEKLRYDNDNDNDDFELHEELIPKHIALIMDGNRRWAKAKGLEVYEGHKLIIPKLKEICDISSKLGIQIITAFAFSTENWKRSKEEVDLLMQLFEEFFDAFSRY
ncbi:hypothetical protein EJD97_002957 [Solanum chilense]|uniref:Alkyl transferase n=1 Tax=Solanum chilense TaxID=4083 RepID=A0A6N2ANB5_SOLCI|nr:hypothetical protein EJD97_002957 [Solanum chilense]